MAEGMKISDIEHCDRGGSPLWATYRHTWLVSVQGEALTRAVQTAFEQARAKRVKGDADAVIRMMAVHPALDWLRARGQPYRLEHLASTGEIAITFTKKGEAEAFVEAMG